MKIDILTLFPGMFEGFLSESIIKRAIKNNIVDINLIDFREYSPLNNKQVDDTIYGGGAGMLLRCEPIFNAVKAIKTKSSKVILLSPEGTMFNQRKAEEFKEIEHLILICGHYEGFDERIKSIVDEVISIGEFVLTGGELASMIITDATVRLLDGCINEKSLESESFNSEYYDYPMYTKPSVYENMHVPEVLLSGNHALINKWREENKKKINK